MATNTILFISLVISLVASLEGLPTDSDYSNRQNQISGWQPYPRLMWNFIVGLDQPLKPNERICITGDADFLGRWIPSKALILNRTEFETSWTGTVQLPVNSVVRYKFFIGVEDSLGGLLIRKWETHFNGRTVRLGSENIRTIDKFGIVGNQREIHRGWLDSGSKSILQLKFFRNPIHLNPSINYRRIFIKVTPVDYDYSERKKLLTHIACSRRANVEVIRMQYGNSRICEQPEYGVPYDRDDIVIFHSTTDDFKNVAYKVSLFKMDDRNPEWVDTIGHGYLLPESIDGSQGNITLNLTSADGTGNIGNIKMGYLLIKALHATTTNKVNFGTSFANYWRNEWTNLDIGHRGLGNSLQLSVANGAAPVLENSVESMQEAGYEGTDMVEFDIHLSSDLIPIIYHDYVVNVARTTKTPKSRDDLEEVLLKDLTYEQIKNLKTYQVVDGSVIEYPTHNQQQRRYLRLFPRLEEFFIDIDETIGFDMEIKWPQLKSNGEYESNQTIDKNVYVDRILDVVLRRSCSRLVFFSSLDADICSMLQFKQNKYPVTFLGPATLNFYADPRSDDLIQTINNAQAMGMLGIVPHSSHFLQDGSRVNLALNLGLKVFIWGDDIGKSRQMVDYIKSLRPTGVCYDRLDLWLDGRKTSIFDQQWDLLEYYYKQCLNRNATRTL